MLCGLAETSTHTSRAVARLVIVRQFLTQNHSGKPTKPADRRGGAVRTLGAGIGICAQFVIASCAGETLGGLLPSGSGAQTTCTYSLSSWQSRGPAASDSLD